MSSFNDGPDAKRVRTGFDTAPPRKLKIKKKVYPSVAQYPTVDFRALLETEREKIEHESNAIISMRGKGSGHEDDKEMLHILIEAESEDQAHRAERMVRDVVNDPTKLPPPVQTQIVVRQSIFGARPPRSGGEQNRAGEFYKEVRVPESVAGGIIGRAGETVKRLQSETNTRIHINRDASAYDDAGTRVIVVRGATQESVDQCERLILDFAQNRSTIAPTANRVPQVAASAPPTGSTRSPSPPKTSTSPPLPQQSSQNYALPGMITENYVIPNHRAGAVIGRNGATIKAIQARYRSRIMVPPTPDPTNPNQRTISISADTAQAIQQIKQEIDSIVEGKASYLANPEDICTPVKIPDDKAGLVIGKQGATIKSIQDRLQVRIQIPSQADDLSDIVPMRTAMVVGKHDLVALAIREIEAIVNGEVYAGAVANAATSQTNVSNGVQAAGAATAAGSDEYAKQWEEYYRQLQQLPPDQQKIALEALAEHQRSLGLK